MACNPEKARRKEAMEQSIASFHIGAQTELQVPINSGGENFPHTGPKQRIPCLPIPGLNFEFI